MLFIRTTNQKDINKICETMLAFPDFYPDYYVNSTKRGGIKWLLQYALNSKDKYDVKSYVMEKDEQIIGHIAYLKDVRCFQGGVYEMQALVVDSNEIGKGYGKILLDHIEDVLKKINARILWMQAGKDSCGLYLSQGYSIVGFFENYWGKDFDRHMLSKNL